MKCDNCKHLETDKSVLPCSMCEHRPHELCTGDRFEQAEPKILTAEELVFSLFPGANKGNAERFGYGALLMTAEKACKNYRLERDLEYMELTEAVEKSLESGQIVSPMISSLLNTALKNLKPLKSDD